MHTNFIRIEDSKELEISYCNRAHTTVRKIVALACLDTRRYIKSYIKTIESGHIPLVLNPKIPLKILKQIAHSQNADSLIVDNEIIEFKQNTDQTLDPGHILCSSGTTSKSGVPKKFFFPLSSPIENARAHYESYENNDIKNILFPLPFSHSFGVVVGIWGSLFKQANTYFYQEAFSVNNILNDIRDKKIDLLYLSPSLARQIIKFSKRYKQEIYSPKIISIGSSTFYQSELLELHKIFPDTQFFYTYGLTEMGPRVSSYKVDVSQLKDEMISLPLGTPLSGVEWEVSETLKIKSIYCESKLTDTFFDTNDGVYLDGGNVYINGRIDDVIIHQGINIYPSEIETLLLSNEKVEDCALIGEDSNLYGEVPILIIKAELTQEEVLDFLKQNLPPSHLPKKIYFDIEIPKTSLGKIQREVLKNQIMKNQIMKLK